MKRQSIFIVGIMGIYGLLLWRLGYIFGSNDQSEMLPYAKYLADQTLYPTDFYIHSIAAQVPNERWIFSTALSWVVPILPIFTLCCHVVFTIILGAGVYRLAAKSLHTEGGRMLALFFATVGFYNINAGSNELYYNSFVPSYLAQSIIIWVIVWAVEKDYIKAYFFLFIATLFHPLAGVQTLVLLIGVQIMTIWHDRDTLFDPKTNLAALGLIVAVGLYVASIKANYDAAADTAQSFFDILEFRASHHYFPTYFSKRGLLLLPIWGLLGWLYGKTFIRYYLIFIFIGIFVYIIGIYGLKSVSILSTQWFKTTVWLKTIGCIGLATFIERRLLASRFAPIFADKTVLFIAFSVLVIGFGLPIFLPKNSPNYHLDISEQHLQRNPSVDIALQARLKTPAQSLYLIPADLSAFRYFSERSIYIDYKATNHRQQAFKTWYERVKDIYNINIKDRREGHDLVEKADQYYRTMTADTLRRLKKEKGITHIVTYADHLLPYETVAINKAYKIYRITE